MKNYTQRRLEDIKEITDELWELIPEDFNYKNVDSKTLYNWLTAKLECLEHSIAQAEEMMYIKGFKDGFQHSEEGFNGEYTHPDVPKDFLEKDAKEALSSLDLKSSEKVEEINNNKE